MRKMPPMPGPVAEAFAAFPPGPRRKLKVLRELIYRTAAALEGVGTLEETLKWGEPAYLTAESRSGSTIRLGYKEAHPEKYFLLFHCQTNLIDSFRDFHSDELVFEGNRAIVFRVDQPLPVDAVTHCIASALTYHLRK